MSFAFCRDRNVLSENADSSPATKEHSAWVAASLGTLALEGGYYGGDASNNGCITISWESNWREKPVRDEITGFSQGVAGTIDLLAAVRGMRPHSGDNEIVISSGCHRESRRRRRKDPRIVRKVCGPSDHDSVEVRSAAMTSMVSMTLDSENVDLRRVRRRR